MTDAEYEELLGNLPEQLDEDDYEESYVDYSDYDED